MTHSTMKSDPIRMRRLPKIVAISILASIILSAQAAGQKTYALGIGGGAAIPVGKLSNTQVTGFNGIIALALGAPDLPIGVRFDGIYNNFSRKNVISAQGSATNTYGFRIAGLLANVVYAFPGTSVKSYIVGGGGLYNTKFDVAGSKSENHAGLNAGAGLTFGLGPIASFIESRYHFISREPTKGGVIHFVPITFGLMF
jgi:Outer membrane protein beta-barrel domain